MLVTDDQKLYERALAYGHYERNNPKNITDPELAPYPHIALGGVKGRANQLCCQLALGQLEHFDERMAEVDRAMSAWHVMLEVGAMRFKPSVSNKLRRVLPAVLPFLCGLAALNADPDYAKEAFTAFVLG